MKLLTVSTCVPSSFEFTLYMLYLLMILNFFDDVTRLLSFVYINFDGEARELELLLNSSPLAATSTGERRYFRFRKSSSS